MPHRRRSHARRRHESDDGEHLVGPLLATAEADEVCPALVARAHGRTDRGRKRPSNEDRFLVASPAAPWSRRSDEVAYRMQLEYDTNQLLVVADGMGGHAGGAYASELAVNAVETALLSTLHWLFALRPTGDERDVDVLSEMCAALQRADLRVCEEAARSPEHADMGTTLTAAYLHRISASRRPRGGQPLLPAPREEDVSAHPRSHPRNEMVHHGILESDDALAHFRNVITNFVGGSQPGVRVEVHRVQVAPGDVILLCTDGLTNMLSDAQIAAILTAHPDPRDACDRLVDAANDAGGQDNVTAVVARCEDSRTPRRGSPAEGPRSPACGPFVDDVDRPARSPATRVRPSRA